VSRNIEAENLEFNKVYAIVIRGVLDLGYQQGEQPRFAGGIREPVPVNNDWFGYRAAQAATVEFSQHHLLIFSVPDLL
jgi:hypothetical protein